MSDLFCLRCGREGHTSDECTRPLPAWPARDGGDAADGVGSAEVSRQNIAGPSPAPLDTGRNDRETALADGPGIS